MRFWVGVWFLATAAGVLKGEYKIGPEIMGLEGKHGLTKAQAGKVVVDELRCAACHDGIEKEGMKAAPDLREVGSRLRPEYIQSYVIGPHGVHSQSTMPGVGRSTDVRSISHYLRSLKKVEEKQDRVVGDAKRGKEIYHEVGCVSCHGPASHLVDGPGLSLVHVRQKYQDGELAKFLRDPLKIRPSGRMPDMKLSREEAADLEAFLSVGKADKVEEPTVDQVKLGKKHFEEANCQACHEMGEKEVKKGPSLAEMDFKKGCLSEDGDDQGKAPRFFAGNYHEEIRAWLEKPVKISDSDRVKLKLVQLNCIACHKRDDFGGVAEGLEGYFHTSEEGLGNEARIPPPLTKIGGKLKSEWMNKVLYDGLSVRPYMKTRMPQFGREALEGLPELLAKVDQLPEVELAEPNRQERPMVSNGGHLLLGETGLNCITCHNYKGKDGPGFKGLDLSTSFQRLQPGWFYSFMKNPPEHRPGIIMPNYWPNGKAVQPDILSGDVHEQIRALWYQFSLGRSARDPKGLKSKPNRLIVTDKVRVYRGRSRIAGYRGIAVGLPGGMNYAFNAENGALAGVWKGGFVTANWRSQGAGDFNPAERAVELAQDVAFLQLNDESEKWPLRPVMTKEEPVNPDPLYPKNRGYAFKGYSLDEKGNPTLKYRCGEIAIEDRTEVSGEKGLRREFKFTSKEEGLLYFRALTGPVTKESGSTFATPSLKVKTGEADILLRDFGEGEKELLIKLPVAKGKTTYTIDYELLR